MVDGDRDELGLRVGGSYRLDPATGEVTRIDPAAPETAEPAARNIEPEAAPSPSISPASPSKPSQTAPKLPPIR